MVKMTRMGRQNSASGETGSSSSSNAGDGLALGRAEDSG